MLRGDKMIPTDTKSQILTAAIDLFASLGYEKTTMRAIAKKVGITSASIYYFFDSKESLLTAIFFEFEANFTKYRNPPDAILKAASEKPLDEVLSMLFYTFGSQEEHNRMMTISRIVMSLQYENTAAQNLYEKIMVQDALDYGIRVFKGMHAMGVIKEINFEWTAFAFHSFALLIFQASQRRLDSFADSSDKFEEGIRFLCSTYAPIIAAQTAKSFHSNGLGKT